MRIKQYEYLSEWSMALRRRDGTAPWAVHISEVDAFSDWVPDSGTAFDQSLIEARKLRAELEGRDPP